MSLFQCINSAFLPSCTPCHRRTLRFHFYHWTALPLVGISLESPIYEASESWLELELLLPKISSLQNSLYILKIWMNRKQSKVQNGFQVFFAYQQPNCLDTNSSAQNRVSYSPLKLFNPATCNLSANTCYRLFAFLISDFRRPGEHACSPRLSWDAFWLTKPELLMPSQTSVTVSQHLY